MVVKVKDEKEDPTEGDVGYCTVSVVDVDSRVGDNDCRRSVIDLVEDELLTDWTTGWMLEVTGVEEGLEVEIEDGVIDEELLDGPIVPDGCLFSAT